MTETAMTTQTTNTKTGAVCSVESLLARIQTLTTEEKEELLQFIDNTLNR